MTNQWQLRLDYTRPPYGLHANDRPRHWAVKATATKRVRGQIALAVLALGIPKLGRCRVEVEWVVRTATKRDPDNLAPLTKAIYDAIGSDRGTGAHLVADDDPAHMEKPTPTIRLDRAAKAAHFLITITDTTPRKDGT